MRVAVNTRLLIEDKIDGIGKYAFEILKRITKQNPTVEFHFIFDRTFSEKFIFNHNIIPHVITPPARHPILWYIWFEIQLPRLLKKINPDIFFSTDGFLSTQSKYPSVTTIHDINFEHRPQDLPWAHRLFYRKFFKEYAHISNHIITVSEFSKKDIIKTYKINKEKISVIYNGVSNNFTKNHTNENANVKKKYTNNHDFFIFIGSLHARKNIHNLLISFNEYKKQNGQYKLLIIGEKKWMSQKTQNTYNKLEFKQDVIFLGRIPDNELAVILGAAQALCFVSLFEGFGLPILEAMRASVPVITSSTSAMPEIAQDAAVIIDPYNNEEISNALFRIEKNKKLREKLIKKGNQRVKFFDWDKSANQVWEILKTTYKCT